MGIFKITRETKIILIFLVCISGLGFSIAYFYYNGINRSEDPRVLETKYMFIKFDKLMAAKNYEQTFRLLDSIETILLKVPGYSESYERGIVFNNRASVYISMALYGPCDSAEKQHLLKLAENNLLEGINHYQKWIDTMGKLSKDQILMAIKPDFQESDAAFAGKNYQKILKKRVKDLVMAQKETPRRLSVAYTNLGIIQRHQYLQNKAIESYIKAITLWKDNYTARNNLNVLFGKPPKDRSIINKLFPPDKNK